MIHVSSELSSIISNTVAYQLGREAVGWVIHLDEFLPEKKKKDSVAKPSHVFLEGRCTYCSAV
jgi:hypothetical protein